MKMMDGALPDIGTDSGTQNHNERNVRQCQTGSKRAVRSASAC